MRNFLAGWVWGGLVAGLGLGTASYLMPARVDMAGAPAPVTAPAPAPEVATAVEPKPAPSVAEPVAPVVPEPVAPKPVVPEPAPANLEPAPTPATGAKTEVAPAAVAEPAQKPDVSEPAPKLAAEPEPAAPEPAPAVQNLPPLQAFAAAFAGDGGKPMFAVILQDVGNPDVDRAAAASLDMNISFAVDPDSAFAAEAMAIYRAAGREVIMLPTSLPAGAAASDIETSMAAYAQLLPETVAVMSAQSGGFQDDRTLSGLIVPSIGAQGRGVVIFDKGLNNAAQIAQREAIPYATISKVIDGAGETVPVMRRYLDRAVFKAAQDGAGVVMGTLQPDTLTALTEWSLEGRASDVALAPISALMQTR